MSATQEAPAPGASVGWTSGAGAARVPDVATEMGVLLAVTVVFATLR
jgi:hypothetical protein